MKASGQDRYQKALLEERVRLTAALEYLQLENRGVDEEEAVDLASLDSHLADAGSVTLEREIDYSLEESITARVKAVAAAIERIEKGSYGVCEGCGGKIAADRLEAVPWTTLCIDCKRREERG
jgi:RNA polymerase-binding transcription factor DksA